jgi:hypothetical protein
MQKIAKTAFTCSICILTLLEVLKTMNLKTPDLTEIKKFVDTPTSFKNDVTPAVEVIKNEVDKISNNVKKTVNKGILSTEATLAKESLIQLKRIIDTITLISEKDKVIKNAIISQIDNDIKALECLEKPDPILQLGYFETRAKDAIITEIEHILHLFSKENKPLINSIEFLIDSKTKSGSTDIIKVVGKDDSDRVIAEYNMTIKSLPDFGATLAEVIQNCAQYAKLSSTPMYIYYTDACYKVPIAK